MPYFIETCRYTQIERRGCCCFDRLKGNSVAIRHSNRMVHDYCTLCCVLSLHSGNSEHRMNGEFIERKCVEHDINI